MLTLQNIASYALTIFYHEIFMCSSKLIASIVWWKVAQCVRMPVRRILVSIRKEVLDATETRISL
jgi:hypothetical protein